MLDACYSLAAWDADGTTSASSCSPTSPTTAAAIDVFDANADTLKPCQPRPIQGPGVSTPVGDAALPEVVDAGYGVEIIGVVEEDGGVVRTIITSTTVVVVFDAVVGVGGVGGGADTGYRYASLGWDIGGETGGAAGGSVEGCAGG